MENFLNSELNSAAIRGGTQNIESVKLNNNNEKSAKGEIRKFAIQTQAKSPAGRTDGIRGLESKSLLHQKSESSEREIRRSDELGHY